MDPAIQLLNAVPAQVRASWPVTVLHRLAELTMAYQQQLQHQHQQTELGQGGQTSSESTAASASHGGTTTYQVTANALASFLNNAPALLPRATSPPAVATSLPKVDDQPAAQHVIWSYSAEDTSTARRPLRGILRQNACTGEQRRDVKEAVWSSSELSGRLLCSLRETQYTLANTDKIFASLWVNENEVVLGTKCNKLLVLKVDTGRVFQIPTIGVEHTIIDPDASEHTLNAVAKTIDNQERFVPSTLQSVEGSVSSPAQGGIHAIAINPARTMIATGGDDSSSVAVYAFPSFDPIALLVAHNDWVFSLTWPDDVTLCSASRDRTVALWSLQEVLQDWRSGSTHTRLITKPSVISSSGLGKPRDVKHHRSRPAVFELSTEGVVREHALDRLSVVQTMNIQQQRETVCMAVDATRASPLLAVGSQTHVLFMDPRVGASVHQAPSLDDGWGVRSVGFHPDSAILSVGGGMGRISFYDLRNQHYFPLDEDNGPLGGKKSYCTGSGWLRRDSLYAQHAMHHTVVHAVYTHSFADEGSRLFVAGGPLQLGLCGSYTSLWS